MTKALRSYPADKRTAIALRRTKNYTVKGMGYWSAVSYIHKMRIPLPADRDHSKRLIQDSLLVMGGRVRNGAATE